MSMFVGFGGRWQYTYWCNVVECGYMILRTSIQFRIPFPVLKRVFQTWYSSRKIKASTNDRQKDTKRPLKDKSTSKTKSVVFFFQTLTVCQSSKIALRSQQSKRPPANTLAKHSFEDHKIHSLVTKKSSIHWKNISRRNPQRNTCMQSFTIKTECGRFQLWGRTDQIKEEVEITDQKPTNSFL
jgi:hypothetical protein